MSTVVFTSFERSQISFLSNAAKEVNKNEHRLSTGEITKYDDNYVVSSERSKSLLQEASDLEFDLIEIQQEASDLAQNKAQTEMAIGFIERIQELHTQATLTDNIDERKEFNQQADLLWKQAVDAMTTSFGDATPYFEKVTPSYFGSSFQTQIDGTAAADRLTGGSGDELINGYAGNDTINGSGGNDEITVTGGRNNINGGGGNDYITNVGRSVRLDGGIGDDFIDIGDTDRQWAIVGGMGDDYILGGTGRSNLYGFEGNDIIMGGDGAGRVWGYTSDTTQYADPNNVADEGDNILFGEGGNDAMRGAGGDDHIDGGTGNDNINAFNGNDYIDAGEGNDTVNAHSGNDTIFGGAGNDRLIGGAGNDIIDAGDGNDIVVGDGGDDVIIAGEGLDRILARDGNDIIFSSSGRGNYSGENGNDIIVGNDDADRGGSWWNWASVQLLNGGDGDDLIFTGDGIAMAFGGNGNDIIIGSGNSGSRLHGGNGDDLIFMENTTDIATASNGNDTIVMGVVADKLAYGGNGDDVFYDNDATRNRVQGQGDTDYYVFSGNVSDYAINNGGGWKRITNISTGALNRYRNDVEYLVFQDGYYDVATSSFNAGATAPGFTGSLTAPVNNYVKPDIADYTVATQTVNTAQPTYQESQRFVGNSDVATGSEIFGWDGPTTDWAYDEELEYDAGVFDGMLSALDNYLGQIENKQYMLDKEIELTAANQNLLIEESDALRRVDTNRVATDAQSSTMRSQLASMTTALIHDSSRGALLSLFQA